MHRSLPRLCRAPLEVLGLCPDKVYTRAEIKDAFHAKAKALHPDAGGDTEKFKDLNNAYEALRGGSAARPLPADGYHRHTASAGTAGRSQGQAHARAHADEARRRRQHVYYERYNVGGERRTWDYGDGASYANQSTANFYRGYDRNYADPQATGFTPDEIRRARHATYFYAARRFISNIILYGLFFYVLFRYWYGYRLRNADRPRTAADWRRLADDPSRPGTNEDDVVDWRENALRDERLRQMLPFLRDHWTDAQRESYLRRWNEEFPRRARLAADGQQRRTSQQWEPNPYTAAVRQGQPHPLVSYTQIRSSSASSAEDATAWTASPPEGPSDTGVEMDAVED